MSSPTITGFKLSSQQRQIWRRQSALDQVLTTQCRMTLQGNLDLPRLQTGVQTVVNHHEILRTMFQETPGLMLPLQTIQAQGRVNWQVIDLTPATPAEQSATVANFQEKQRQAVKLAGQVCVEVTLFKLGGNKLGGNKLDENNLGENNLGEDQHILLLTMPALCADTETCEILLAQISQCYGGRSLAEEPVQYVQFATWQEQLLTEVDDESQAAHTFWQHQLSPSHEPLLPPLRYRDAEQDKFTPNLHRMELAAPLAETLLAMDTSVEAVLLTSWLVLLWRHTEQSDITLGVSCEGRQDEDLADVCGVFNHMLPLHSQLSGAIAFTALLRQVEQNWQDLNEWQDYYPSDRSVTLPISFEFIHQPATVRVAGVEFSLAQVWSDAETPELKLTAIQQDNQLVLEFHYDETVVSEGAIAALSNQLQVLLTSISQQPTASIDSFALADEVDSLALDSLAPNSLGPTASVTLAPNTPDPCIHHRIEQQVERTPEAIALIYEAQQLTYGELNYRANQLAHHLQQLGAGPEVPVAIYLERSLDLLIALLAILKTGAAYLPIDIVLPSNGVSYRLEDAQAKILVTRQSLLRDTAVTTQVVCLDGDRDTIAQHSSANLISAVTPTNLAYIIYTSGSTGQPKGVAVEHRQLCSYINSAIDRLDLPAAGHYATVSTFAADLGHTMIFPCLCQGGTLHVIAAERVGDAQALVDYTQRHPIDCLKIVPSHLRALLQTPQPAQMLPRQRLVLGGEACSWSLMDQIQQLAPHCRRFNHYGPTETTVGALTYAFSTLTQQTAATVPVGRSLANSQVYLLDSDLRPVPIGIPGEVYIGGGGVTRGYLHRPGLTAARFLPDPFSHQPGGRMYRTGDLARRHPDGNLEFLRRVDLQVKLHGFRIELGEIEAQLTQHPNVEAVSAIVREDEPDNPVLVAYVVPNPEETAEKTLDSGEFRLFLRQRLPNYMIPSLFVILSALPLTPNGKVDRQALPAPERIRPELAKEYVAPRNPTEEAIAAIWTDVLGLETVGVNDNFFDLGGHSLLATQVLSRLRDVFQVELPLRQLFDAHTVAEIAEVVETALLAEIEAMTDEEVQALMQE